MFAVDGMLESLSSKHEDSICIYPSVVNFEHIAIDAAFLPSSPKMKLFSIEKINIKN